MRIFFKVLIGIIVAYFLTLFAFVYEENYRQFIQNLYELLTENKISFENHGKYLHFVSGEFISAFLIFLVSIFVLLKRQSKKQRFRNMILGISFLIISTIIFCFIDSNGKLIECTACNDGKRVLDFNDLNYDLIFISSVIFGILPAIVTEIRNRNRKKTATTTDLGNRLNWNYNLRMDTSVICVKIFLKMVIADKSAYKAPSSSKE